MYYESEQPIPNETHSVSRRLRLGSASVHLESILKEFFTLEEDNCWHQKHCDEVISNYKHQVDVNRNNGKLGGRPSKTESKPIRIAKRKRNESETKGNQEPITNNQINTSATFVLPDWICKEDWDLWVSVRKKMNNQQKQKQVEKLDGWRKQGLDFAGALKNAGMNGTQGLFLPPASKFVQTGHASHVTFKPEPERPPIKPDDIERAKSLRSVLK